MANTSMLTGGIQPTWSCLCKHIRTLIWSHGVPQAGLFKREDFQKFKSNVSEAHLAPPCPGPGKILSQLLEFCRDQIS